MYSIECEHFTEFLRMYEKREFKRQRLGQAFYNYFELHKMSDANNFNTLYELSGQKALDYINSNFNFT